MSSRLNPVEGDQLSAILGVLNLDVPEDELRAVLSDVCGDSTPSLREYALVTVAALMAAGGIRWPSIWRLLNYLRRRTIEQLRGDAVALINGTHYVVPDGQGVVFLSVSDGLKPVESTPPALVATVYSLRETLNTIEVLNGNQG